MKRHTEWNPSPPDPAIFASAFARLWRARITENELWMPETHYRQVQDWLDKPPYDLDPKTCVFSPKEDIFSSAKAPPIPTHSNIDITSRVLAERKEQTVRVEGGASIKLEWFEFVDREAKSIYWSEVLRRKAWQEPPKEK